ncbi:MAG TPA: nucleotidyltransferase domain-containing protein [Candidatus Acidoferrum sp.]|nr:nucleotidyltransferase domain-containing protein [Candidatus Acidoferrum sp.]
MKAASGIDDATAESVRRKLAEIERAQGVRILFAVESGSRAWGFPSPDSDYDVRFVYRHPRDWYLSLVERRDVIEVPLDADDHDISGWDIRKAMQLLLRSNPPLYEWLVSPIVYREDGATMAALRALAERGYAGKTMGWHYLRMADRTYKTHAGDREDVKLKKYFYVIRPLCALIWLVEHGTLPPMNLAQLLDGIPLAAQVRRTIDRLLEQKSRSSELGRGKRLRVLDRWIERQLLRGEKHCHDLPAKTTILPEAEDYFRRVVDSQQ